MKNYTGKQLVLAFLLGVFCTVAGYRWYMLENEVATANLHISYIEGFLNQVTRGAR